MGNYYSLYSKNLGLSGKMVWWSTEPNWSTKLGDLLECLKLTLKKVVFHSVKSLQNVVMKADETLSGIFTKFDEELVVSWNHAHVVIDFDLSTINTQFYQIKIAIENSNFLW